MTLLVLGVDGQVIRPEVFRPDDLFRGANMHETVDQRLEDPGGLRT